MSDEPLEYVLGTPQDSTITFVNYGKDLLSINQNGIKFHLDNFSGWTPDDFATEFIKIVEQNFTVHFEKCPPEVRQGARVHEADPV